MGRNKRPSWTYLTIADRRKFSGQAVATELFLKDSVKVFSSGRTEKEARKTAQQAGQNIFNIFWVPLIEEQRRFFADSDKVRDAFGGQYVVACDFKNLEIVVADKNPDKALAKARQEKIDDPVIFFLRPKGEKLYLAV
ncbi:MAG: hypothetical protein PHW33_02220 [Candidatus Portnoybacteria bacterium]|jgi:hypothetical protein|nr:hypothetical protein [Candidatus Portnoybacteria bacterium]